MLPRPPRMGFFDDVNPRMRSTAGQTLKISCDTGFVPSPSDVMTCRADGTWTEVSCVEEGEACYGEEETVFFNFDRLGLCDLPPVPLFGYFVGVNPADTYALGDALTVECNAGYLAVPSNVITCQADGSWGPTVSCFDADALMAGPVMMDMAFEEAKPDEVTPPPLVVPDKMCAFPITPAFGHMQVSGINIGATATFWCDAGFSLTGAGTIHCEDKGQATGSWSDLYPRCTRGNDEVVTLQTPPNKVCAFPITPAHGHMTVTGTNIGATATFSCDPGFTLTGAGTIHCEDQGRPMGSWSDLYPRCTPAADQAFGGAEDEVIFLPPIQTLPPNKVCAFPITPAHGHMTVTGTNIGATATFSCDPGFTLTGAGTIHCEDQGRPMGSWSDLYPRCTPAADQAFGGAEDEVIFLPPIQTLPPNKVCAFPITPAHGHMTVTGTNIGATATFSCDPGFTLTGAGTIHCEDQGRPMGSWSDLYPRCTPAADQAFGGAEDEVIFLPPLQTLAPNKVCAFPIVPANGHMTVTGTNIGATATFWCDAGFSMTGAGTIHCEDKGLVTGSWSDLYPRCTASEQAFAGGQEEITFVPEEQVTCALPSPPLYGYFLLLNPPAVSAVGESVVIECDTGYVTSPSNTITCLEDGTWGPTVSCVNEDSINQAFGGGDEVVTAPPLVVPDKVCMFPITPMHGHMQVSGMKIGDTATFWCDAGFSLIGAGTIHCQDKGQSTGSWSDSFPYCAADAAFTGDDEVFTQPGCRDPDMGDRLYLVGQSWGKHVRGVTYSCECEADQQFSCREGSGIDWAALGFDLQHPPQAQAFSAGSPIAVEATSGCFDPDMGHSFETGSRWAKAVSGEIQVCECQAAGRGGQRLSCHLAGDAQVRSGPLQLEACYDEETGQAYLIGQHWIEGRLNKVCHCVPGDNIVCQ
ncbi:PREDICTED: sushi, von Willebrand factor type A, EGF and pentraxin domain-containing protein 1-like [Branchiostoma belcheri]|uniref:Sushi, von Willebrand factor type A, EGF and pentraxin domain-containing protein 1-like n=1 Tax=Branchiostoma belcheri TaxID=7741 RepID=A0A6P4ZCI8_BRABE|nr:PREDICTED: sushi, von Willebrand factor type A, EGF and pentraxin domain-containing protein 1-like [Branchiostoma belcheri]